MSFKLYQPTSQNDYGHIQNIEQPNIKQSQQHIQTQQFYEQIYWNYTQNQYLHHQLMHQQYQQMYQQQLAIKNKMDKTIFEGSQSVFEKHSEQNLNEEIDKSIHNTQIISKYTIKKDGIKIRKSKPQKNETKNIPKNYGKAIVSFIQNNKQKVKKVLENFPSLTLQKFNNLLQVKKNKINSIADLRMFWLQEQQEEKQFAKMIRILSNIFLRHFSLQYIFNSRISNYSGHVKYRTRLIEALRNPESFTSIKQY